MDLFKKHPFAEINKHFRRWMVFGRFYLTYQNIGLIIITCICCIKQIIYLNAMINLKL